MRSSGKDVFRPLNLQTHMYASDANRRWVKINNVEYHQGDVVDGQVTLKEIQPQAVIVEFKVSKSESLRFTNGMVSSLA